MSALRMGLADYLALRRSLGYKLRAPGKLLAGFLDSLEACGAQTITTELALAWANNTPRGGESQRYQRLLAVRGFARYMHSLDQTHEVPSVDLIRSTRCRATPYLYSDQEVVSLMAATDVFTSPHRRATYRTLIGLVTVTAIRRGEVIALDRADFDPDTGTLLVREGKFGKERLLPLHASTVAALCSYLERSDRPPAVGEIDPLLISETGTRLLGVSVQKAFSAVRRQAGLGARGDARPRVHDLRHTFAVRTMLDAYRAGEDVEGKVALLSTYLGHVDPANTYWYLQAAPELMALAGERLERYLQGGRR